MIVHDIDAIEPLQDMPNLPVASIMWKPQPDMFIGNEAWILCGGTHHSILSYDLTSENMKDFVEIIGIECIHINKDTLIEKLRLQLALGDIIWSK